MDVMFKAPVAIQAFMLILFLIQPPLDAQDLHIVSGIVINQEDGKAIPYAHISLQGGNRGTIADRQGKFRIQLSSSSEVLRISSIGYHEKKITIDTADRYIRIALIPAVYDMGEVSVTPNDSLALSIIRKAISSRDHRMERLSNYRVEANTKAISIIDSARGISESSLSKLRLRMNQIAETKSIGHWKNPDSFSEEIIARRQTSRLPIENTINSMPLRTDLSADKIIIGKLPQIIGPISQQGLDTYYYRYVGTEIQNTLKIHRISVTQPSSTGLVLSCSLMIEDSTYLLMNIDLKISGNALPLLIDSIRVRQVFRKVAEGFWLPANVNIYGYANMSNFTSGYSAHLAVEAIMSNYEVNLKNDAELSEDYAVVITEKADSCDSLFWENQSYLVQTPQEIETYRLDDSLHNSKLLQDHSYNLRNLGFGETLDYGLFRGGHRGLINSWRYNRVEGAGFGLPLHGSYPYIGLNDISLSLFYSLSDRKLKHRSQFEIDIHNQTSCNMHVSIFDDIIPLDYSRIMRIPPSSGLSDTNLTSLFSLLSGWDPIDYYYSKGFAASLAMYVSPFLRSEIIGTWKVDHTARVNTRWSLLGDESDVRSNSSITDGTLWSTGLAFALDTRPRVLIAGKEHRVGDDMHLPSVCIKHNRARTDEYAWTWTSLDLRLNFELNLNDYGCLNMNIDGRYADNLIPVQELFSTSGSLGILTDRFRFKTLGFREIGGDQSVSAFFEYRHIMPFLLPSLPVLFMHKWQPIIFASATWSDMRKSTKELIAKSPSQYEGSEFMYAARSPFVEAGLGIAGIFGFIRLDFSWRLNHYRDKRNFMISLSMER
jgi:hypothetical protein